MMNPLVNSDLFNNLGRILHVVFPQLILNGFLQLCVVAMLDGLSGSAGEHVPEGVVKHADVLRVLHPLSDHAPQGEHQGMLLPHSGVQGGDFLGRSG